MKSQLKRLAPLAAMVLAGCASGGGGGSDGVTVKSTPSTPPSPTAEMRCAWLLPFLCGWFEPGETETDDTFFLFSGAGRQRAQRFATWSSLAPHQAAEFEAIATEVSYTQASTGAITSTSVNTPAQEQLLSSGPQYTAGKELVGGSLGRIADGIDVSASRVGDATQVAVIANPYAQGWNYQSFGVWNTHGPSARQIASSSFGAPTPASAVPSSGTASFVGKLGGVYVSPSGEGSVASADIRVHADFGNRSLGFASSNTRLSQDLKSSTPAPHLNLGGTLTYSPAANTFTGTITNAGGTMSGSSTGRYYGPTAQELGGVFTVKSPATAETLTGAYGAKR